MTESWVRLRRAHKRLIEAELRPKLEATPYEELNRLYCQENYEHRELVATVLRERYQTQRAVALEKVALSRASRSSVIAGASTNSRALKLRVRTRCDFAGAEVDTEALTVMDQDGNTVPAPDFYEYLRQYFGELCAMIRALAEHVDGLDYVGDESDELWEEFNYARDALEERGHFNPMPWPLKRLFRNMNPPVEIILAQEARNREREVGLARMVWSRRISAADPLNIVISFLGGRIGAEQVPFLPRDELPEAMRRVVDSYNSDDNNEFYWDADVYIYCAARDQIPVWSCDVPVGDQAHGYFYHKHRSLRWSANWEGETESDTEDEKWEDTDSVDWSSSDSEEYFSASSEDEG